MKRLMIFLSAVLMLSCTIAGAQRIASSSFTTLAYIRDDGTMQDASFRTIGYFKPGGTVQDASFRTIGYVKPDGTVQDSSFRTIGYAKGIPRQRAAFYFFFMG